jgi:uncharacterized protein
VTVPLYRGLTLTVLPTDSEHRGYFEAAGRGELVVQRCSACGMLRGDIGAACPFCQASGWEWHSVSGKGVIYSYSVVAQPIQPAFREFAPYPVVLVELDEQRNVPWRGGLEGETVSVRLTRNLVRRHDPAVAESEDLVAIGKRVEACFFPLANGLALPQFCLSDEPPEHEPWQAGGPAQ